MKSKNRWGMTTWALWLRSHTSPTGSPTGFGGAESWGGPCPLSPLPHSPPLPHFRGEHCSGQVREWTELFPHPHRSSISDLSNVLQPLSPWSCICKTGVIKLTLYDFRRLNEKCLYNVLAQCLVWPKCPTNGSYCQLSLTQYPGLM